jgi:hypothetical protein
MLRVTFYSYKGGVGRTLALLNCAAVLASQRRRVLAVDFDLEAPGFGLSALTQSVKGAALGLSDYVFDRLAGIRRPVGDYIHIARIDGAEVELMPAGTQAGELAQELGAIIRKPAADQARVFELLIAELSERSADAPHYVLFDSRTGFADSAGLCTVQLPQVLVAVCGLNEQNVFGMEEALKRITNHPARVDPCPTLLVLSPVPREQDFPQRTETFASLSRKIAAGHSESIASEGDPLSSAIARAQRRLLLPYCIRQYDQLPDRARARAQRLRKEYLLHVLDYDPVVPLSGELHLTRTCTLSAQYHWLAYCISLVSPEPITRMRPMGLPLLVRDGAPST